MSNYDRTGTQIPLGAPAHAGQPGGNGVNRPGGPAAPQLSAGGVKTRRRPLVAVLMVAFICLGALLSAWAYTSTSNTQEVLAVRTTVHRGEVITAANVATVRVGVDPALKPVSADEIDEIVGKRAAMDLSAGGLITAEDYTDHLVPGDGKSVVGIRLTTAAMPAGELFPGDEGRVVATSGEQGEVSSSAPISFNVSIVQVTPYPDLGETVIDVAVLTDDAAELAAHAATGNVALVLDSRER